MGDSSECEDEAWADAWCDLWQSCIAFVGIMGVCMIVEGILDGCCMCYVNAKRCAKVALFLGVCMFVLAVTTSSITVEWKQWQIHDGICCAAEQHGNLEDVDFCWEDGVVDEDGWSSLKWIHVF